MALSVSVCVEIIRHAACLSGVSCRWWGISGFSHKQQQLLLRNNNWSLTLEGRGPLCPSLSHLCVQSKGQTAEKPCAKTSKRFPMFSYIQKPKRCLSVLERITESTFSIFAWKRVGQTGFSPVSYQSEELVSLNVFVHLLNQGTFRCFTGMTGCSGMAPVWGECFSVSVADKFNFWWFVVVSVFSQST